MSGGSVRRSTLLIAIQLLAAARLGAQAPDASSGAGETTVTLGGLLQIQAEAGDRGDSRFSDDHDRLYLRRARLNAAGTLLADFDFRLEADFAGGLSASSGLRGQLTDAFVNWHRLPRANVRVGQFKTPFGFEQLFSDPKLATLERSLANDRLTLGRQLGVQLHGELVGDRLRYAVGAFNGNGANNNFNDDDRFLVAARLSADAWRQAPGRRAGLALGAGAYTSTDTDVSQAGDFGFDDDRFTGERRGLGLDTQLTVGRLELSAEYLAAEWEPDSGRPRRRVESRGGYIQAVYDLVPRRLQAVAKLESFDPRRDRRSDDTETALAGVNWLLRGDDLKLVVDYLRVAAAAAADEDKVLARLQIAF
jgi:phosphate-selective porin